MYYTLYMKQDNKFENPIKEMVKKSLIWKFVTPKWYFNNNTNCKSLQIFRRYLKGTKKCID